MGNPKKSKKSSAHRKQGRRLFQALLGLIVVAGVTFAYFRVAQDSPATSQTGQEDSAAMETWASSPTLQNRLVLPAQPHSVRPVTLSPNSFSDPEVQRAYQVAKEVPAVLEHMPCYCGCYGSSGHRNNLDCFADNHGVT